MQTIASFFPLCLMGLVVGGCFFSLAKRKGENKWIGFLAGFAPGVNILYGIWLASHLDKEVKDQIENFISEFKKYNLSLKPEFCACHVGMSIILNCPIAQSAE